MKVLHLITRMNTGGPAVFLDHLTHAIHPSCESVVGYGYCEFVAKTNLRTKNGCAFLDVINNGLPLIVVTFKFTVVMFLLFMLFALMLPLIY